MTDPNPVTVFDPTEIHEPTLQNHAMPFPNPTPSHTYQTHCPPNPGAKSSTAIL